MYKITFKLRTAVSFIERPTFDGLLAWCYMKEKYGIVEQKLNIGNVESFDDMPLVRHSEGYFLASWMQFDENLAVEFTQTWKKRWANQHDHLANFGKKIHKVMINKGEFKSYDMQIVLQSVKEVWFFFASDDVDRVRVLVSNHLWGIGKKTAQGYGEIESFEIEEIEGNPFLTSILRPIPVNTSDLKDFKDLSVKMMGFRPPYWLPENQVFCLV